MIKMKDNYFHLQNLIKINKKQYNQKNNRMKFNKNNKRIKNILF